MATITEIQGLAGKSYDLAGIEIRGAAVNKIAQDENIDFGEAVLSSGVLEIECDRFIGDVRYTGAVLRAVDDGKGNAINIQFRLKGSFVENIQDIVFLTDSIRVVYNSNNTQIYNEIV